MWQVHAMRAAHADALSFVLPGGDACAYEAYLRHLWAIDTWRSAPATAEVPR